jgi:hypothetical protein
MVIYDSASIYIDSATDLCDKVVKIEAIIIALEDTALKSATSDDITEYSLDDGQTKIKTVYKGTDAILKSIESLIRLKEYYRNKLNGRQIRLVDSKSLRLPR